MTHTLLIPKLLKHLFQIDERFKKKSGLQEKQGGHTFIVVDIL